MVWPLSDVPGCYGKGYSPQRQQLKGAVPFSSSFPVMIVAALVVLPAIAPAAYGQSRGNHPTVGYVYPAGGKQGTTFEVTVGGQFLQGVASAAVSGKGVHAEVVEHVGPVPQKQIDELREKVKELRQRRQAGWARNGTISGICQPACHPGDLDRG